MSRWVPDSTYPQLGTLNYLYTKSAPTIGADFILFLNDLAVLSLAQSPVARVDNLCE
jgi:hypothetical protein